MKLLFHEIVWQNPENIYTRISIFLSHTQCWIKFAADKNSKLCSGADHCPSWECALKGATWIPALRLTGTRPFSLDLALTANCGGCRLWLVEEAPKHAHGCCDVLRVLCKFSLNALKTSILQTLDGQLKYCT